MHHATRWAAARPRSSSSATSRPARRTTCKQATELGAPDGVQLRHERAHRAGVVRRRRRRRVPRPRLRHAQGLQREEGAGDRRGDHAGSCATLLRRGEAAARRATATRSTASPRRCSSARRSRRAELKLLLEGRALPPLPPRRVVDRRRAARASAEAGRGGALRQASSPETSCPTPSRSRARRPVQHVGDLPARPRDDRRAC